jgi:pilus assembly protein FimV
MKRKLYIFMLLTLAPKMAIGIGLGDIELNSVFNEPFGAKVQLLSPTADELDSLNVGLADSEAFARANIDRPFILSELEFTLRRSPDYISIYSKKPIREPFLNFLIEVSWSNGKLFREYTVLLDPPQYNPKTSASEFTENQSTSYISEATIETDGIRAREQKVDQSNNSAISSSSINYSSGDYGPTNELDTLWSIASSIRRDSSISLNQMMSALFHANPQAFFNQNMNGLKRGQILRMPNENEINALTSGEASTEVKAQNIAWSGVKNDFSMKLNERPVRNVTLESSDFLEASADELFVSELKLVTAEDTGKRIQEVSNVDGERGKNLMLVKGLMLDENLALPENLILAEDIQGLTDEQMELQERMDESETLLEDLNRLVALKDNKLAMLQGQVVEQNDLIGVEVDSIDEEIELMENDFDEIVEIETAKNELLVDNAERLETVDEEVVDVIKSEIASSSDRIMGDEATGTITTTLPNVSLDDPKVLTLTIAVVLVSFVLILFLVIKIFRKKTPTSFENIVLNDTMDKEVLPELDSGSEVVTDLQSNSEDETLIALPELDNAVDEQIDSEGVTIFNSGIQSGSKEETDMSKATIDLDVVEEAALIVEGTQYEDPMQEVNTYIAFEQFDEAEAFARNVVNKFPDNVEYHMKLLEVFYTAANKKSYEQEANFLYDKFGEDNESWSMVMAMWSEMSPNRDLFEKDVDDANDVGEFIDITDDGEARSEDGGLDFDTVVGEEISTDEAMLDIISSGKAENLLNVTSATSLEEKSSKLLGLKTESESESLNIDILEEHKTVELGMGASTEANDDDNLIDFDIGENENFEIEISESKDSILEIDLGASELDEDETSRLNSTDDDDNLLDFDMGEVENLEIEISESKDPILEIDLGTSELDEDETGRLNSTDGDDILLDFDMSEDENIEIEISESKGSGLEIDLVTNKLDENKEIEFDKSTEGTDKTSDLELDMNIIKESETAQVNNLDFESNMEDGMSLNIDEKVEITENAEQGSNDDENIAFVPAEVQVGEQTLEDEVATKLDLLKAYVELGDKDSAKTISDEIMDVGNDEQRQQAENLLEQV